MVLTAPRVDPRSTTVRLRSRYIMARDATVTVAIYVGEPPMILDGCVVEEVAWAWASTSDNGVVTVADAGGGTLTLLDPERRFDPANPDASTDLTQIGTRVQIVVAGLPAFTGRVDDVAHDLHTAQIALVDDVSALASIQFTETAVPAERADLRLHRILDMAAWPMDRRVITTGGVSLQAGTVAADAWSELVEVNRNELGALWIGYDGKVYWRPRDLAWAAPTHEYVANGSFEQVNDPNIQYPFPLSWTGYPDGSYTVGSNTRPQSGSRNLWIGPYPASAHSVFQDIQLTPGQSYRLSAYGAQEDGGPNGSVFVQVLDPNAAYAAIPSGTLTYTNRLPYLQKTTTFLAPATTGAWPAGTVRLEVGIGARAEGEGYAVDVVSLTGPGDPALTVGCPPSDFPLVALATRGDQSDLVNVLSAARRTGTQRTVTDPTSLATYGRHSHVQNDLELASDPVRDAWQDFYLRRQAQPVRGVGGFAGRPGAAAIQKALSLPFGSIVRVKDEGHGPPIDRPARLVGTRWRITPSLVELVAVTGEDASISPVDRVAAIDTPTEWIAAARRGYDGAGVVNGSFDQDMTGWYVSAGDCTVITAPEAVVGTKVARIAGPGNTPYIGQSATMPVAPGTSVRLRYWAKRMGGTLVAQGSIHTYNAAGGAPVYHAVSSNAVVAGGYVEVFYNVPADGSVGYVQVALFINAAPTTSADVWYFDDVTLTAGNANPHAAGPGVTAQNWPAVPA